jgi:tetratricopeptide (TPR) repeat protein
LKAPDALLLRGARAGVVQAALRVAEFDTARNEGEALAKAAPRDADAISLYGDALWASGLFEEAELRYRDALALTPGLPRGLHGIARSLLARSQLDGAMNQAQAALRISPRDLEIHHTVEHLRRSVEQHLVGQHDVLGDFAYRPAIGPLLVGPLLVGQSVDRLHELTLRFLHQLDQFRTLGLSHFRILRGLGSRTDSGGEEGDGENNVVQLLHQALLSHSHRR